MRKLLLPLVLLLATLATAGERSRFPYIYKFGASAHLRSSGMDIERIVRISKRWDGPYVWLRVDGRDWLIRDAAVLAQVKAVFADMHALEPRLRAASEKRDPYERKIDAIEEKMDAISDLDENSLSERQREANETRLRQLEREMEAIERDYQVVDRQAEALEREMDRLEEIAEGKFEQIVLGAVRAGKAVRVDS